MYIAYYHCIGMPLIITICVTSDLRSHACKHRVGMMHESPYETVESLACQNHQFKGACIPNAKRESYILNLNATPEIVSCRIWIAVKINRWFSKRIPEFIWLFNILTVFL